MGSFAKVVWLGPLPQICESGSSAKPSGDGGFGFAVIDHDEEARRCEILGNPGE